MRTGATYSPGSWIALVSRSAAVLIDPEVPSTTLDALWRSVEHAQGMDRALEALTRTVPTPDFAIAIREPESVRLLVGGSLQITVHQPSGSQRVVRASGQEQRAALDDVLWFLRPGGRSDGVALPIVIGAVLADVLSWQSSVVEPEAAPAPARPGVAGTRSGTGVGAPRQSSSARKAGLGLDELRGDREPLYTGTSRAAGFRPVELRSDPRSRRSPGLGSHPRRRYGAADWSLTPHESPEETPLHGVGIDTAVPEVRAQLAVGEVAGVAEGVSPAVEAQPSIRPRRAHRQEAAPAPAVPAVGAEVALDDRLESVELGAPERVSVSDGWQGAPAEATAPADGPHPGTGADLGADLGAVVGAVAGSDVEPSVVPDLTREADPAALVEPVRTVESAQLVEPVELVEVVQTVEPVDPVETVAAGQPSATGEEDFSWMSPPPRADEPGDQPVELVGEFAPDGERPWTVEQPWESSHPDHEDLAEFAQPAPQPQVAAAPGAVVSAPVVPEPAVPEPPAAAPVAPGPVVAEPVPIAPQAPAPSPAGEPAGEPVGEPEPVPGSEVSVAPLAAGAHSAPLLGAGVAGVLVFTDGTEVVVDGPVIIGRAPSQTDRDRPARLVTVRGEGRGVSRNHLRIDVGTTGPFAIDLGSRNGSTLTAPGAERVAMDSWMPYPLVAGVRLTVADLICDFRAG